MWFKWVVVAIATVLYACSAFSSNFDWNRDPNTYTESFINPEAPDTFQLRDFLNNLGEIDGSYAHVGFRTEGMWMSILSNQREGYTVLMVAPTGGVRWYNEINRKLIELSNDRIEYLNLRYAYSVEDWRNAGMNVARMEDHHRRWVGLHNDSSRSLNRLKNRDNSFLINSYLVDDEKFGNVKNLEARNKIIIIQESVYSTDLPRAIRNAIGHLSIGIFDIANSPLHMSPHIKQRVLSTWKELKFHSHGVIVESFYQELQSSWKYLISHFELYNFGIKDNINKYFFNILRGRALDSLITYRTGDSFKFYKDGFNSEDRRPANYDPNNFRPERYLEFGESMLGCSGASCCVIS